MLADDSKTLARERPLMLKFSSGAFRDQRVGSPTHNVEFPLKVADIVTTSSHEERIVQVADLFAGIVRHAFAPLARRTPPDEFAKLFIERLAKRFGQTGLYLRVTSRPNS